MVGVHSSWTPYRRNSAKCDFCDARAGTMGVLQRCDLCGMQCCRSCLSGGKLDRNHRLDPADAVWTDDCSDGNSGVDHSISGGHHDDDNSGDEDEQDDIPMRRCPSCDGDFKASHFAWLVFNRKASASLQEHPLCLGCSRKACTACKRNLPMTEFYFSQGEGRAGSWVEHRQCRRCNSERRRSNAFCRQRRLTAAATATTTATDASADASTASSSSATPIHHGPMPAAYHFPQGFISYQGYGPPQGFGPHQHHSLLTGGYQPHANLQYPYSHQGPAPAPVGFGAAAPRHPSNPGASHSPSASGHRINTATSASFNQTGNEFGGFMAFHTGRYQPFADEEATAPNPSAQQYQRDQFWDPANPSTLAPLRIDPLNSYQGYGLHHRHVDYSEPRTLPRLFGFQRPPQHHHHAADGIRPTQPVSEQVGQQTRMPVAVPTIDTNVSAQASSADDMIGNAHEGHQLNLAFRPHFIAGHNPGFIFRDPFAQPPAVMTDQQHAAATLPTPTSPATPASPASPEDCFRDHVGHEALSSASSRAPPTPMEGEDDESLEEGAVFHGPAGFPVDGLPNGSSEHTAAFNHRRYGVRDDEL